jgi:hypothetical protein
MGVLGSRQVEHFEVVSEAPYFIAVTFMYKPQSSNKGVGSEPVMVCMKIFIGINGNLQVTLQPTANQSTTNMPCTNEYATEVLSKCHHIPLAWLYMMNFV